MGAGRLKRPRSRAPHNYSKSPVLQPSRRFVTFCDSPNTDGRSQTRHVCRISSSSHLMPSVYCNRLANSGRMQQIDCITFMGTSHLSSAPLPFRGTIQPTSSSESHLISLALSLSQSPSRVSSTASTAFVLVSLG